MKDGVCARINEWVKNSAKGVLLVCRSTSHRLASNHAHVGGIKLSRAAMPHTVLPESGRGRRTAAGRRRRQNSVRLDWSGVEEAGNQVSKLSSFFQFLREGHHKVGKSCAPELERLISVSLCGWFIFRERESECSCVWILPFCLLLLQSKDREAP
jgi:hypothetical protein